MLEFFEKYPDAARREAKRRAVEKIKANVEWVLKNRDVIAAWLYNNIDISH